MAPSLGFNFSHLQKEDKDPSAYVKGRQQLFRLDVIKEKMGAACRLGLTGRVQLVFPKTAQI
jgi:hypothetical protein